MNVFDRFVTDERTIAVEALDGAEVTIRELTVAERKRVDAELMKDAIVGEKGQLRPKPSSYQNSQILAVSLGLVEPKMSIQKLEKLSAGAVDAIAEIYEAILSIDEAESKRVKKK